MFVISSTMPELVLSYTEYYTHFSFLLFIISFMLPFTYEFKHFILLNSIIVGIVGNILLIQDYPLYIKWFQLTYPSMSLDDINKSIQIGNAIFHTIPMIIAFLMYPGCSRFIKSPSDIVRYIYYQMISIVLWSLLPFKNMVVQDKIAYSYPSSQYLSLYVLISCLICLFILYKSTI